MIGRITGTLIEITPPGICIQAAGLGYEVDVPMSTLYKLPALGETVSLYTHLSVREDAHTLYGFASANERSTFRALIKVTGIGARTALAVLSGMSAEDLANAVEQQETGRLMKVPGIGKKTAERLILELRGKLKFDLSLGAVAGSPQPPSANSDVLHALQALGYSANEARKATAALPADLSVAEGIRQALQNLARA